MSKWNDNKEIEVFREYLRIASVHPDINYDPCIEFLKRQAQELNLLIKIFYPTIPNVTKYKKPIVILTLIGENPMLPSILLSSHMDVVPVFSDQWLHPPFSADIDGEGRIYARGAQDMKCVGMQYLAALRALRADGIFQFKRTIHVCFTSDEEVMTGTMGPFTSSDDFRALNVGFVLDEGMASPTDVFPVYYGERTKWIVTFKCNGTTGHGSLLLKNTAIEKIQYLLKKFLELREVEAKKLEENSELTLGDITTINVTGLDGGVLNNVVPANMSIRFDIRLALDVNLIEFEEMYKKWCEDCGGGIDIAVDRFPFVEASVIDESNPYWMAFKRSLTDELKLKIKTEIFPAGTDATYSRLMGIPALGFSPMNNTPVLLHDHNEYLQADVYLKGIEIYKAVIRNVANV